MTLRRQTAVRPPAYSDSTFLGYFRGFRPEQITDQMRQGDGQIATLADVTPRAGDSVVIDSRTWQAIGVTPVYDGAVLIGFDVFVRGG